ncbi:1050_t:CDS:2, partial [Paraglomus occultum]
MDGPTNTSNGIPTSLTFLTGEEYEAVRRERIERNRALMTQLGLVGTDSLFLGSSPGNKLTIPVNKTRQTRETSGRNSNKTDMAFRSRLRSSGKIDLLKENSLLNKNNVDHGEKKRYHRSKTHKKWVSFRCANPGRRVIGGRVYDSELGTTCHQCRQKTTEEKVSCTYVLSDGSLCPVMFDERCLMGRKGLCPTGILKPVALKKGFDSVMDFLSSMTHFPTEKLATRLSTKNMTKICDESNSAMVNVIHREHVGPEVTDAKVENPLVENKHNLRDYSDFTEYEDEEEMVTTRKSSKRYNGRRKDNEDRCESDKGKRTLYNEN